MNTFLDIKYLIYVIINTLLGLACKLRTGMDPFGGFPMKDNNCTPSAVVKRGGNGLMKAYSISSLYGQTNLYGLKILSGTTNQDVTKSLDRAFYYFRLCTGRFELANFARDLFVLKTFALRKNLHQ